MYQENSHISSQHFEKHGLQNNIHHDDDFSLLMILIFYTLIMKILREITYSIEKTQKRVLNV